MRTWGTRIWGLEPLAVTGTAALLVFALAACDGAPSATPARAHASGAADRGLADVAPDGQDARSPARGGEADYAAGDGAAREARAPAPLFHGKPVWAANKNHTAQENADYHWKRDGEALGATSQEDFLTKVHAFVDNPPAGAQTLVRANGDRLIYDAKANLFAVVDKDGAPRTLFKPRDGGAYWKQQQDSLAADSDRPQRQGRAARRGAADDNG